LISARKKLEENTMAITKTKNGTYRVRKKYPRDVALLLELKNLYFDKIFKTMKEAKLAELEFDNNVQETRRTQNGNSFELGGEILFKNFYSDVWLDAYCNGLTSTHPTPPTKVTAKATKDIFRLHILPMFGQYSLNYLNQHKQFVVSKMTKKAHEYANFKTIRSYVNQVFDLAEEYDYIENNRLSKSLKKIKAYKKQKLKAEKNPEEQYLSEEALIRWFYAIKTDYEQGFLTALDYTLFWTTFFLSNRKSESYALQWRHIDFDNNQIILEQTLDKVKNPKIPKSRKKRIRINLPKELKDILVEWKLTQQKQLEMLGIKQSPQQFLFTQCDRKGNINRCVHIDYLNYRMKKVRIRHPELEQAAPQKLRHTSATLASRQGMSIKDVSEGLTHADTKVTDDHYIHNDNVIQLTPAQLTYNSLKKSLSGE
jgi:integrase